VLAVGATARAADRAEMITVDAQGMKFAPVPGMPGCATVAILRGNPRREASVVLVKLAGGSRVPWHWHTANEQLLVVSGVGVLDMKEGKPLAFRPGAYASLPSHHVHQARCSRTCLFFSIADDAFDIHYVDNEGNEIPEDEALKKQAVRKARKK
jgi:quercetin dioxygenase-like cupin family protein